MKALLTLLLIAVQPLGIAAQNPAQSGIEELVRAYLWPENDAEFMRAQATLRHDASLVGVSRMVWHDLEEVMRRGPAGFAAVPPSIDGQIPLQEFSVEAPEGADIPVLVRLPSRYSPHLQWPLMFAMHGGPPRGSDGARRSAERMIQVWAEEADRAGWIVAAPAMVTTAATGIRTRDRLPYEIFHPEQARAVIGAVRARYNVNPDRIVSTGISLGSNFSLAYAAAQENWISAIVPVSTEGESRELLLRNLNSVPLYVLEGSLDQNIRGVAGPRALNNILTSLGYDITYREFGDQAHEGFQEHYGDVLRWLDTRPRKTYPREVLRVPHAGIMPVARRVHWIETDTRQALVRAVVTSPTRIDITARWVGEIKLFLHDRLVDLDRPIEIWANGVRVFAGDVARSVAVALLQAKALGDERKIYAAEIAVKLPTSPAAIALGEGLTNELSPRHPEGTLSFWEMYATRALEERFPTVGFDGEEAVLPTSTPGAPEQVAIRVTRVEADGPLASLLRPGDLLLDVGGEPFFSGRRGGGGGVAHLYQWMLRELRAEPASYPLTVWRAGNRVSLDATFGLGPYLNDPNGRN